MLAAYRAMSIWARCISPHKTRWPGCSLCFLQVLLIAGNFCLSFNTGLGHRPRGGYSQRWEQWEIDNVVVLSPDYISLRLQTEAAPLGENSQVGQSEAATSKCCGSGSGPAQSLYEPVSVRRFPGTCWLPSHWDVTGPLPGTCYTGSSPPQQCTSRAQFHCNRLFCLPLPFHVFDWISSK